MAWLAVDQWGDEMVCDGKPERLKGSGSWEYLTSVEGEMVDFIIYLPKGSIEKLIGKQLTWGDEPVEI